MLSACCGDAYRLALGGRLLYTLRNFLRPDRLAHSEDVLLLPGILPRVRARRSLARGLMQFRVSQTNLAILKSEKRFRAMLDAATDMIWEMNASGDPVYLSPRFESYFGLSLHEVSQCGWTSLVASADRPRVLRIWRRSLRTGQKVETELRLRRFDGALRWFAVRIVPVRDANGTICGKVGGCTDIHDLKRSEQALKRSNSELQQFAYAAAHDLQEPLRNVATCLGMLHRQHAHLFDSRANEWIDASIEGAQRMHEMVKDLLMFSTILDPISEDPRQVSAAAAVRKALIDLSSAIEEAQPHIEVADLPELAVEEQHAVQLFRNLLSNSLKYRRVGIPCSVSIAATSTGSDCCISVRDNGVGFDPSYASVIFQIFKRLHSRSAYPGNGIGLAICERIVSYYGGRIWAEGAPDMGAAFYFTLPLARLSR